MDVYLQLLDTILNEGVEKSDRTNTGTLSIFGWQSRYKIADGFPLLTTKKLHFKSIVYELLWFLKGETNIAYLKENDITIWNEWADENGDLGPVYGKQWRRWATENGDFDQIQDLLNTLKNNPNSRRMMVSAWNVSDLHKMRLHPCHLLMQFYVANQKLSCQFYQRSADVFLGVPFNIASYALLLKMIAHVCDLECGELIHTIGDAHLYTNHIEQAKQQLTRKPHPLPQIILNPNVKDLFTFDYQDIQLSNYVAHPHIPARVAV